MRRQPGEGRSGRLRTADELGALGGHDGDVGRVECNRDSIPVPDRRGEGGMGRPAAAIAVMPIPDQGLGRAINDRLIRAARTDDMEP